MEITMKKSIFALAAIVCLLGFGPAHQAFAQPDEPIYYDESSAPAPDDPLLSAEEMDDLLAPIALYPDPLIAQILPAATFVDQIDQAARYVRQYGRNVDVDNMPWDVSVKSVAHY